MLNPSHLVLPYVKNLKFTHWSNLNWWLPTRSYITFDLLKSTSIKVYNNNLLSLSYRIYSPNLLTDDAKFFVVAMWIWSCFLSFAAVVSTTKTGTRPTRSCIAVELLSWTVLLVKSGFPCGLPQSSHLSFSPAHE